MTRFHINKHGMPAVCKANKGKCPLGDNSIHFHSEEETQDHIDRINKEKFGILRDNQVNKKYTHLNEKLKKVFDEKHLSILNRLDKADFQAYFVGGSLRDATIDLPINDVDITTSATPEEILEVFSDCQVIPVGLEHGTVVVMYEGEQIEITTFRTDGEYSDGRRPDEVQFTTDLSEDIQRRDFTINSLAYSPKEGLIDMADGISDIENGLIRTVGSPDERFQEDPLRIMRGLRFASKLGFEIEEETSKSILKNKSLLKNVSAERIQSELNGLLMGKNSKKVLMEYSEVIEEFIPEVTSMIGFEQNNPHHKYDVWEHSATVVENAKEDPAHKMAALLHDIGKPDSYTEDENGVGHFLGHGEKSVKMSNEILTRLRYSIRDKQRILNLIEDHDGQLSTKRYKIAKRIYEVGPERYLDSLDFIRADDKGKDLTYRNRFDQLDKMEKVARDYLADSPILNHKDLAITPKDIIDLGFKGEDIKRALNKTAFLTMGGHANNRESQIRHLQRFGLKD